MKRLEDVLVWMVKQMELAMPVEIEEELTQPEHLSATEYPSQEH